MKNHFISLEIAKRLKQVHFNKPVIAYYRQDYGETDQIVHVLSPYVNTSAILEGAELDNKDDYPAPLCSQVLEWLREDHNMMVNVYTNASGFLHEQHDTYGGTHRHDSGFDGPNDGGCWDTFQEAQDHAILTALKIVYKK